VIAVVLGLAAASSLVHFQSPSGNINCIGSGAFQGTPAFVSCLVRKNSWPRLAPKPARCDLDWNPATLELGRRHVSVGSCRGDIGPLCTNTSDRCSTLAYGRSVDVGPIRCSSAPNGVTCRYRTAPRVGFRIAREGYVTFRR
jgi:Family of unknown function (DUF6636)